MKNRIISFLLAIVFLLSVPITAFAEGDGNVDSGGGGMGSGTGTDSWTPGYDGVRVSVVNAETGATTGTPIDYSNVSPASGLIHFGKKSKIQYSNGSGLSPVSGGYNAKKTFDIKDELKAAGAKFNYVLNWHFAEKPETYATVELTLEDCFWENSVGALNWNDNLQELIKERTPREPSASEYLGEVGKRLTVTVTLKKSFSFESDYGSFYPTTTYIHNFEDESGNVIIWKTTKNLTEYTYGNGTHTAHELISCELTGTVKEHSEYRGTKQAILTRCKIAKEARA